MRVINIVTQMEAGGAQGAAIRMAMELRSRGHTVETWFLYQKRPTYIGLEGVKVVYNQTPKSRADYLTICLRLIVLLKQYKPDCVITYTHYANIVGQIIATILRIPIRIATQRSLLDLYPRFAKIADKFIGCIGCYTHNIAVSSAVYDCFSNYPNRYKNKLEVVNNGIEISRLLISKEISRERYDLPKDMPLIINVGRLSKAKNQLFLIRLLPYLQGVNLAIAGDGELREVLLDEANRLGVSERLFILGEIKPEEVRCFLCSGDLFIFPSLSEAFGFALVEAMSVGLPIITSDIPAFKDILKIDDGEEAGILISLSDKNRFITSIKEVLKNEDISGSLASKAIKKARHFSIEKMVDSYEKCFYKSKKHN
ncbi:hypothetical protein N752_30085 [Desulforamulus aquiferis]|nr:glycosyltransferase family 4 protein [Desulforamulus aquiferis]RYD01248.1 hypothetical protein N752_30085 [Desulforamulus aquiferis]